MPYTTCRECGAFTHLSVADHEAWYKERGVPFGTVVSELCLGCWKDQEKPMSYSDITLEAIRSQFGITVTEQSLFPNPSRIAPTPWLQTTLAKGNGMALISEKSRNEFIVAPVLLTCRELMENRFYIYSGVRFDIDGERGLKGECDFILSRTPPLPIVTAPVAVIVEAKKQDIEEGLGQCAAQMLAARIFNEREGKPNVRIGGCVTTGETWQFLSLEGNRLTLDAQRYYIIEVDKILWIVSQMVG